MLHQFSRNELLIGTKGLELLKICLKNILLYENLLFDSIEKYKKRYST